MKTSYRLRSLATTLISTALVAMPVATALGAAGEDSDLSAALTRLGLTANDVAHVVEISVGVPDPTLFRFAATLDPPSLEPAEVPWAVPERIGVAWAIWPDSDSIPLFPDSPDVVEGALFLPHGGPVPGTEYALMWAQMGGQIPIDPPLSLYQSWSFPFAASGATTWQPPTQFPYDTWGNASVIPYISYGPDPHVLAMSTVASDGALLDQDFEGFGIISGDTIIIGVATATLFPNGIAGALFGFAGHVHDGGFGADPESRSLMAYATGDPGSLVAIPPASPIEVGASPPLTTTTSTTTTLATTSTTGAPTTTAAEPEAALEVPATSGFPWLPILLTALGVVVIAVGGRLYLVNAKDPCAELLAAWTEAEQACREATAEAKKRRRECDKSSQRLADLERLHRDLCTTWPPACQGDSVSTSQLGEPATPVTSSDLHARRVALGRLWDDFREGRVSAERVDDVWRRVDSPEFREELSKKTGQRIAQREVLERDIEKARQRREEHCEQALESEQAATIACDKASRARTRYEECSDQQSARSFLDVFLNRRTSVPDPPSRAVPAAGFAGSGDTPEPGISGVSAVSRHRGEQPASSGIDKTGLDGNELTRAERLERILRLRRGTGDLALVAKDLWQFDNWHLATFGEPWFLWSARGQAPVTLMETRLMTCFEFVHLCGYIAGDQPLKHGDDGDHSQGASAEGHSLDWAFSEEISTNSSPLTDRAPAGAVITGSFKWGDYDNVAGYYHTGISIGDGRIISLGSDGLILEDAVGLVDACFPGVRYTSVAFGDYAWGKTNPAPR